MTRFGSGVRKGYVESRLCGEKRKIRRHQSDRSGAGQFFVRKVFVVTLGRTTWGLSGLFTDILSMLSLAELGFGTSVVYSLYKPLAEGDTEKIKSLDAGLSPGIPVRGYLRAGGGDCVDAVP